MFWLAQKIVLLALGYIAPTTVNQKGINRNLTILLAEDDIDDQELLRESFLEADPSVEIVIAPNGAKAVAHLKSLPPELLPDLIVLDYNMPELNGAQVLEVLRSNQQYTTISKVILSTSHSPYYKDTCLSLGADGYFTKPSSYGEMGALIKEILQLCTAKKSNLP